MTKVRPIIKSMDQLPSELKDFPLEDWQKSYLSFQVALNRATARGLIHPEVSEILKVQHLDILGAIEQKVGAEQMTAPSPELAQKFAEILNAFNDRAEAEAKQKDADELLKRLLDKDQQGDVS